MEPSIFFPQKCEMEPFVIARLLLGIRYVYQSVYWYAECDWAYLPTMLHFPHPGYHTISISNADSEFPQNSEGALRKLNFC